MVKSKIAPGWQVGPGWQNSNSTEGTGNSSTECYYFYNKKKVLGKNQTATPNLNGNVDWSSEALAKFNLDLKIAKFLETTKKEVKERK